MKLDKRGLIFVIILFLIMLKSSISATPLVSNLIINSSSRGNTSTENLTGSWTISEAGFKNVTVWYLNNNSLAVLYLPFENNSNASLTEDYSTYHNNGNVSGAVYNISAGYDGFGAYNFTERNYINIGPLNALTSANHSYGAWVKFNNFNCTGGRCLIMSQVDYSIPAGVEMYTSSEGLLNCTVYNTAGSAVTAKASQQLAANKWYYITCRLNDTALCISYNNTYPTCTSMSGTFAGANTNFIIGGDPVNNQYWFNGTIDEVMAFNRRLSTSELRILSNQTNILSSFEIKKNEVWHFSVTPVNASEKGAQVNSSYLQILDQVQYFKNITLDPNIRSTSLKQNFTFNCSSYIEDPDYELFNVSFFWYEGDTIIISNNTAGSNMSNFTNVLSRTTVFASANLTGNNYKFRYNYSCGIYVCNGQICNQSNSSTLYIGLFYLQKLNYLGNPRAFAVGVDDFGYGTNSILTNGLNYKQHYDGLRDILMLYDSSNQTKFSFATIPRPTATWKNYSNISTPNKNFRWILADLEYDKYINIYLHGDSHNLTAGIEYVDTSLSQVINVTNASYNIYKDVIGRNSTSFKFPGYNPGSFGKDVLYSTEIFPYKSYVLQAGGSPGSISSDVNNTVLLYDNSGLSPPASSFGGNYFASGHDCSTIACFNGSTYRNNFLTTINYAESENNISYLDFGELGEVYTMYTYTTLRAFNDTTFELVITSNWTAKRRLAINVTDILDDATHPYLQITTPSGLKVAQNMTRYTGSGANRAALVIIPVENGNYTVTNLTTQPTDPSFKAEDIIIYANNTKWSFNGTNDSNASAYMVFKLNWTGPSNIWGDYNNTNIDFNFTHGFRFNQSQGDNWWVEHDMKSGKLHILGNSSDGIEYITAQLPFTFVQSVNTSTDKQYIINTTNMFKNITSVNLSIPEPYNSNWRLNISYANGTNLTNVQFYQGSSIIFNIPIIMEDSGIIIDYWDATPPGPPSGSGPRSEPPSPEEPQQPVEPAIPESPIENIIGPLEDITGNFVQDPIESISTIVAENSIIANLVTESGIKSTIKLILEDVGLLKKKPKIEIEFEMPWIEGIPKQFKMFNIWELLAYLILLIFIFFIFSLYFYVKSGYKYVKLG